VPYAAFDSSLVVAWELLDTVPCPVLEVADDARPRRVLVDPATGRERLGGPPGDDERRWCARWWPLDGADAGTRGEVGAPRDAWWQGHVRLLSRVGGGLLLAVDYAHTAAARPPLGTLSGYRAGRLVPPVPNGSCDVTAHVALDAVEAAGRAAGASRGVLLRQDEALRALGATPDSPGAEELLDAGGLGGFTWLLQGVGRPTWNEAVR
jgi:SAM-dependent MidA family methyltransferase